MSAVVSSSGRQQKREGSRSKVIWIAVRPPMRDTGGSSAAEGEQASKAAHKQQDWLSVYVTSLTCAWSSGGLFPHMHDYTFEMVCHIAQVPQCS